MTEDWQPAATAGLLKNRAAMLKATRDFFAARNVLEVETPTLTAHPVSDPQTASIAATTDGTTYWLRTSPEYHMKRLLAAYGEAIYQVCKVFRAGERGRYHEPEFTMIEWYRPGFSLSELIDETCELVTTLARTHSIEPGERTTISYAAAFEASCGLNPLDASLDEIRTASRRLLKDSIDPTFIDSLGKDRNSWLDLLYSHVVVASFPAGKLCVVRDYPAEQAMLARLNPDNPAVAERFELFWGNLEIANGFFELQDPVLQAERFAADNQRRAELGLREMAADPALLGALEHGLPECSGVAVGFDRLLMLCTGSDHIDATISFPPGS